MATPQQDKEKEQKQQDADKKKKKESGVHTKQDDNRGNQKPQQPGQRQQDKPQPEKTRPS